VAFWKEKRREFDRMDRIIKAQPGIRPAELARRLDVARSTVTRRLPSREEAGYLYAEDQRDCQGHGCTTHARAGILLADKCGNRRVPTPMVQ
jgi:DNA-binding transcriptional ArsR family regulator